MRLSERREQTRATWQHVGDLRNKVQNRLPVVIRILERVMSHSWMKLFLCSIFLALCLKK